MQYCIPFGDPCAYFADRLEHVLMLVWCELGIHMRNDVANVLLCVLFLAHDFLVSTCTCTCSSSLLCNCTACWLADHSES